jgi:hypothetical protein
MSSSYVGQKTDKRLGYQHTEEEAGKRHCEENTVFK